MSPGMMVDPPLQHHPFSDSPQWPHYLSAMPSRFERPQLRIITDTPTSTGFGYHAPARPPRPVLIKTAPLLQPFGETQFHPIPTAFNHKFPITGMPTIRVDTHQSSSTVGTRPLDPEPVPRRGLHRRRLSDKFKSLFSGLHGKRDEQIRLVETSALLRNPMNENLARRLTPTRPHRSPGTASFLVTRHPLFPQVYSPISAHSSHTAFSISSRLSHAGKEKTQSYLSLLPHEISHFSNPTTMTSSPVSPSVQLITTSTLSGHDPYDLPDKLGPGEEVMMGRRIRKIRSMPDLRASS